MTSQQLPLGNRPTEGYIALRIEKSGDVAQLGERLVRNQQVEGSNPFVSISGRPEDALFFALPGGSAGSQHFCLRKGAKHYQDFAFL